MAIALDGANVHCSAHVHFYPMKFIILKERKSTLTCTLHILINFIINTSQNVGQRRGKGT